MRKEQPGDDFPSAPIAVCMMGLAVFVTALLLAMATTPSPKECHAAFYVAAFLGALAVIFGLFIGAAYAEGRRQGHKAAARRGKRR